MIHERLPRKIQRGSALIVVLGCLVFVTMLVVAFNMSMRSKMVTSKSSSDANGVKIMAETAVNIAISQVRDATLLAGTKGLAWASQPGMIRLYDNNGTAAGYYKLYSGENMVSTAAFNPFSTAEAVPADWHSQAAVFTDLNAPANGVYPIVDPSAIDPNPGAEGVGASSTAVDEFTVKAAPLAPASASGAASNPIPMPVKWLYILADGSFHLPDSSSAGTKAVILAATAANPIVGRVAFWADDETCKVNVNTASVAKASTACTTGTDTPASYKMNDYNTFWDVPRFTAPEEFNFAFEQPAQGEYQRYPGHPATVGLNAVLSNTNISVQDIFQIAPRYAYDGSKGGTVKFDAAQWIDRNTLADRLYASTDEVIFNASLTSGTRAIQAGLTRDQLQAAKFFLTSNSRAPELNLFGQPRISIWPIDSTITLGSSQRVTTLDRLIAFCSTVSGSTTAKPFYFTRKDPLSTKTDIELPRNQTLLNYLDQSTGRNIPGFGGNFKSKYTEPESRQILTEIFDYVRTTNTQDSLLPTANVYAPAPNGGWQFGKGQVTPSIHATWNTQGFGSFWRPVEVSIHFVGLGDGPLSAKTTTPTATAQPAIPIPKGQIELGMVSGTNGTKNFNIVLHEGTITEDKLDPADTSATPAKGWIPPTNNRAVQAFVYVSFLNPAQSRIDGYCNLWLKISGLDSMKVSQDLAPASPSFKSLDFPTTATTLAGSNTQGADLGTGLWFGYLPITSQIGSGGQTRKLNLTDPANNFPFFSKIVAIPFERNSNSAPTFVFSGGTITIDIYDLAGGPNSTTPNPAVLPPGANKVQSFTVTFPQATLPMPGLTKLPCLGTGATTVTTTLDSWGRISTYDRWLLTRQSSNDVNFFNKFDGSNGRSLVDMTGIQDKAGWTASDVIQSMVLSSDWSDARLLAGNSMGSVNNVFTPHPKYGQTAFANSLFSGGDTPLASNNGIFGKLVAGKQYSPTASFNPNTTDYKYYYGNPCVPPTLTGVTGWDWDNGIGNYPDGPWINKADEGSRASTTTVDRPYFQSGQRIVTTGTAFFSPNRQVSSPGMFGSLSTGVSRHQGWQTLLFRPGNAGHPGSATPKDHLLMDLFWMPVVEPYAISEPFSTAGKINLNQQLVPFTYINRYTALRAALMGEKVAQMPKGVIAKSGWTDTASLTLDSRLPLNLSESNGTLKQLVDKFGNGEIYKSATEICDLYLVPQGYTWPDFANQWYGDNFALVGDNVREKPYSNIYGKLTTKSNTYTVHYRVQTLRQTTAHLKADPTIFDTARGDKITAEQRGSSILERYLDASDSRFSTSTDAAFSFLSDPGNQANASFSLEPYYRVRILNSKVFNP